MWFKFPEGAEGCSIEQQSFASEYKDAEGRDWFRAPAHFAPAVLGTGLGYEALPQGQAPEGCTIEDDLPTHGALGAQVGERAQTIASLQADLMRANETIQKIESAQRQAEGECAALRIANTDLEKENTVLRARLTDFESEQDTQTAVVEGKNKK